MIVALTLVVLVMAVSTPGDKPKALREFERARSAERMTTVRAEILLIEPGAGIAGGDFRGFTFFEAVGPEYCVTSRGDEDGVVALVNGKPRTDFGPLYSYVADGEAWSREERGTFVHVDSHRAGSSHDPFDLRTLGSNPWCFGKDLETFAREAGLGTPTYSERTDGGLYVVTAELTKAQARWWLDPEKDWSVVRTQVLNEGAVQFEQVITVAYDRHDQMWFPSRVEEYRRAAGESSPSRIIEVLGVEFNRPDHKVDLSPVDVGVEPGMQVIFQNHQPVDGGYWDGSRVVKRDEFKAGIDAGTIAMGIGTRRLNRRAMLRYEKLDPEVRERAIEEFRRAQREVSEVITFENDWEKYTREFIEKHKLDEETTQRAWAICRECVDAGKTYAASVIEEIESIDASLKQAGDADSKSTAERQEKLRQRREKLHEPLGRIFAERLVPRLDRLVKPPAKP